VLGAQEVLKVNERIVTIAESLATKAEDVLKGGEFNRSDYLQAKRHLDLVRLSRDEARDRYDAAWQQLATIVGCSPMQPVPILDDLSANIPMLELESSWQLLLTNSPQLRSSECDLGHAWATYQEAQAQAIPNVTLQVVSEYDSVTRATTVNSLVALPIPIFNQNQGNIDKTAADVTAAEAEIRRVQLVLKDQMSDSFRRYKSALGKVQVYRSSILPSVEESVQLSQRRFDLRETGIIPVLTAQQEYSKSQIDFVETLVELHKVIVEIEGYQLTGGLNPAAIGSAIQNAPGGGAQRQRALLNEAQDRNSKQIMNAAQIGL
jgi:cobalt-zinc-cadmium efflux system outer membrane protein